MTNTPADVIDLVTTRDAATFVDAVNSILNKKAAEAIGNMRQEVAQNIINPAETRDETENQEVDAEGESNEDV